MKLSNLAQEFYDWRLRSVGRKIAKLGEDIDGTDIAIQNGSDGEYAGVSFTRAARVHRGHQLDRLETRRGRIQKKLNSYTRAA